MRALVVDDSNINLKVAKKILEHIGLDVDCVLSGFECLEIVKKVDYDVIFMDIMMPKMDGIETFKRLVEDNINTPVVCLTADAGIGKKESYLKMGFYEYLEKPINITLLKELISKIKTN